MNRLAIAATFSLVVAGTAQADSVLVLNSEEASYSILSRSTRTEVARLPVGREPHHLIVVAGRQGRADRLDRDQRAAGPRHQDRRAKARRQGHPRSLPAGLQPRRQVVRHGRPTGSTMSTSTTPTASSLAGRIFIDGLPSHIAFDAESKTVFVVAAAERAARRLRPRDPDPEVERAGRQHAGRGRCMLPDNKRLLVGADRRGWRRRRRPQGWHGQGQPADRQGCA